MNPKKINFSLPHEVNQKVTFPHDGLCYMSIEGTAPFSYEFHCIDTDTYYSDQPILCNVKKESLPFFSYKDRVFSLDFKNKSFNENHINLIYRFERRSHFTKNYSFREYTLDGLYRKNPIEIEAGKEVEVSLTNFRGGDYEVHEIQSPIYRELSGKIIYRNQLLGRFDLENTYRFKRPWVFRWPDSAILYLRNEGISKLEIQPNEIYFAGYLLKPTKVIEKIAPLNARNSFLIEGIVA